MKRPNRRTQVETQSASENPYSMATVDFTKSPADSTDDGRQEIRTLRTKSSYRTPQLTEFGDVRDVVLGMSPGIGDSGNPTLFKP